MLEDYNLKPNNLKSWVQSAWELPLEMENAKYLRITTWNLLKIPSIILKIFSPFLKGNRDIFGHLFSSKLKPLNFFWINQIRKLLPSWKIFYSLSINYSFLWLSLWAPVGVCKNGLIRVRKYECIWRSVKWIHEF